MVKLLTQDSSIKCYNKKETKAEEKADFLGKLWIPMLLCRMLEPQIKPIWQEVLFAKSNFFSIKGKSYFTSQA